MTDLEPMSPAEAKRLFIAEAREDRATASIDEVYEPVLDEFTTFLFEVDVGNLNSLTGRKLHEYKSWLKSNTEKNVVSLNGHMCALRVFLRFCSAIEAVSESLPPKTPIPNVPEGEEVCEEKPPDWLVEAIDDYYIGCAHPPRSYIEWRTIREIACRLGALRGLDVCDVDIEERVIRFRHRPGSEIEKDWTPLKNGNDSQREVNISKQLAALLNCYLEKVRYETEDRVGRRPLLTSKRSKGRIDTGTIRRDLYKLCRPCDMEGCPHDGRDPDTCKAVKAKHASKCPSAYSSHPLRRWSIEQQLDKGVDPVVLSDRADVSVPVLEKHYDTRSEERKRKARKQHLAGILDGYGDEEDEDEASHESQPTPAEVSQNGDSQSAEDENRKVVRDEEVTSYPDKSGREIDKDKPEPYHMTLAPKPELAKASGAWVVLLAIDAAVLTQLGVGIGTLASMF